VRDVTTVGNEDPVRQWCWQPVRQAAVIGEVRRATKGSVVASKLSTIPKLDCPTVYVDGTTRDGRLVAIEDGVRGNNRATHDVHCTAIIGAAAPNL